MQRTPRTILTAATIALAAVVHFGCGASRPVKYYELGAPSVPAVSADPYPLSLLVGRISASRLYRDDRIVYETGGVQMGMYEYQRWAEPPVDMVQAVLVQTLRSSGQYRSVDRMSSNARGDYVLRGRLVSLQEVDQPEITARVRLDLELFHLKSGTTVWTQSYSHDEPVPGGQGKKQTPDVTAVVETLNRNLQQGVQQLTAGLGQYFASHPPQ
jgi:ABC-type uncharacterized transport system auxiliary subunit